MKPQIVIKTFVLSIFEWPFYTGFTVFRKDSFENVDFEKIPQTIKGMAISQHAKSQLSIQYLY